MSDNITLADVLIAAIDAKMATIRVSLPGKVKKWYKDEQLADIEPLIKPIYADEEGNKIVDTLPIIPKCPVEFPRAGDWFISFPIVEGVTGRLVFCDFSIDQYLKKGELVEPESIAQHDLNGAVFIPGLNSEKTKLPDVHADNIVIGKTGGTQIHVKDGTISLGEESPSDQVALASLVKSEISALRETVNSFITGPYALHKHGSAVGVTTPPDTPGTPPAAVGDVKSEVVGSS